MKVSETYPNTGQYLKAVDHVGQTINASIAAIDTDTFERENAPSQTRLVAFFTGVKLGLVLSPTNARALAAAYGDETTGWVGKTVIVTTKAYDIEGKKTHGFVIFPGVSGASFGAAKPTAPPTGEAFNDSIPF